MLKQTPAPKIAEGSKPSSSQDSLDKHRGTTKKLTKG
jgi:hypothetical protein